ncbi:anti-sigma factor [Marivirga sp. S37H4]|uniref:Regulator of SigK n=1 Tax=Marivirga aurantiaca TaxID=2802615 RepID=A0A935CD75_9BACT|nr:anti-sigma factor [Marivirga aurantiaca]MBK6266638.1 anti-sigma factor [Marivirga aurantiaca]
MNIENYISSGIIEAYVLDQLTEQERKEVQILAEKHPEIRQAIDETEETLFAMGQAGSVAPPGSLKKDLFYDLGIDLKQNPENNNFTEEVRNDGNTQSFYPYLTAAASIIAILGIVLTFYYRGQWVESEQRLSALYAQNETLAQQYNIVKNQSDQYASNMEILRQPGIENVPLEGLELSPDAQAMVHWNKNTNEVYLNAKKMPANEVAQQYQLWAIVEGKPVDMGVFDVGGDMTSLLKMKSVDKASAFAVTLEPRGGSENPTMEKMYVIGQI